MAGTDGGLVVHLVVDACGIAARHHTGNQREARGSSDGRGQEERSA
jgi:hypothetical protein